MAPPSGSSKPGSRTRPDSQMRIGWKMAGLGMETASFVLGGVVIGWGAKTLFGGTDTWILIGGIAGILSGISQLIRGGLKLNEQLDRAAGVGKRVEDPDSKDGAP